MTIETIYKRDGRAVPFDARRIQDAIHRAFVAVYLEEHGQAAEVTAGVVAALEERFPDGTPAIEDIQDAVVQVLRNQGYEVVAGAYEQYRAQKAEVRALQQDLGYRDIKLTVNALEVLRQRYLLHDAEGNIAETPAGLFHRIAHAIALPDAQYGGVPRQSEKIFFGMMARLEFMPNSPTLFNAGTPMGQLSACFVIPVHDSLDSIFTAVKQMAIIEQTGGGVGFDFSELRPAGDMVKSTHGIASGPISFMRVFDTATDIIKAGGRRRGALMGILRVDHPDILKFVTAKQQAGNLTNFNISVATTDDFMRRVEPRADYSLINPRTGAQAWDLNAGEVWDILTESAWSSGDPGLVFIDKINEQNPTPQVGKIASTNPCGEQPLLPFESCVLGSINLGRMVVEGGGDVDWDRLREAVREGVHFLDNVVDANVYPLPEIDSITRANRKIGLGVMGWADLLLQLGIPYDSEEALALGGKLMAFVQDEAHQKSIELGLARGSFPNYAGSTWEGQVPAMRNATVTTVAPTGTISIIAGCSSGIEPIFAIAFMRNVLNGTRLFETHPLFERVAKEQGFYSGALLEQIARSGSSKSIPEVPEDIQRLFATAFEIAPEWHVRMQAAFQEHCDNAVSKTINLPTEATVEDVRAAYRLAWTLGCKGITVFRNGSKPEQVLYAGGLDSKEKEFASAEAEYAGGCPSGSCYFPISRRES